jgi:hypothetical protein
MFTNQWVKAKWVLLILFAYHSPTHAAEDSSDEQAGIDFKGKVVLLIVDHSNALENKRDTEYISNAVIQKLGGRYFITGNAYSLEDAPDNAPRDWRKGSQLGIAWEKVQQFYIFSPERMEEMIKRRLEEDDE